MGIGRFINKQIERMDGFRSGGDDRAMYFEGDTGIITRPLNVEGDVTGTNLLVNAVQIKAGSNITAAWKTVYTWNVPAIAAMNVGSINSIVSQDVAMSGAAVGDFVVAAPVGSVDTLVGWDAACYSANNIKLRAWYTGSITLTPGNVPFKILDIKL